MQIALPYSSQVRITRLAVVFGDGGDGGQGIFRVCEFAETEFVETLVPVLS
jgi:hypothetical protein